MYSLKQFTILQFILLYQTSCISGVMVSMLAFSTVDYGFEPWLIQTEDYDIGICPFYAKHAALRSKNKDGLVRYQDIVF